MSKSPLFKIISTVENASAGKQILKYLLREKVDENYKFLDMYVLNGGESVKADPNLENLNVDKIWSENFVREDDVRLMNKHRLAKHITISFPPAQFPTENIDKSYEYKLFKESVFEFAKRHWGDYSGCIFFHHDSTPDNYDTSYEAISHPHHRRAHAHILLNNFPTANIFNHGDGYLSVNKNDLKKYRQSLTDIGKTHGFDLTHEESDQDKIISFISESNRYHSPSNFLMNVFNNERHCRDAMVIHIFNNVEKKSGEGARHIEVPIQEFDNLTDAITTKDGKWFLNKCVKKFVSSDDDKSNQYNLLIGNLSAQDKNDYCSLYFKAKPLLKLIANIDNMDMVENKVDLSPYNDFIEYHRKLKENLGVSLEKGSKENTTLNIGG